MNNYKLLLIFHVIVNINLNIKFYCRTNFWNKYINNKYIGTLYRNKKLCNKDK